MKPCRHCLNPESTRPHDCNVIKPSIYMASVFLSLTGLLMSETNAVAQGSKQAQIVISSLQDAFVNVADTVEPAVVTVTSKKIVKPQTQGDTSQDDTNPFGDFSLGRNRRGYRSQGTGSGVIISSDGWILTNDHVIGGADRVTVKLHDGREYEGVVRRDYRSDLALIKVNASGLPSARLGDSDKVKTGMWAIAIGSPFRYEGSFSVGVVSSLKRQQIIRDRTEPGGGRLYPDMIQTDAAINPGNSGGPLVNIDGEVIAINTAIESESGGSVGIGFAIPINAAKFVINQLQTKGSVTYGYLGIEPDTVTAKLAEIYKVGAGALVKSEPSQSSPAGKAGIHVDDVIIQVQDKAIRDEVDFRNTISRISPGTEISLTVYRGGTLKKILATLSDAPAQKPVVADAADQKVNFGVVVEALTQDQATRVGLTNINEGVVVKNLDRSSSAGETEIVDGDVILKINDKVTPDVETFKKVTNSLKSGDVVRIIYAGKRFQTEHFKRVAIFTLD